MKDQPSALLRYSLPVLANALALLATALLGPAMEEMRTPLLFAAVAVCAWYGGLGPSLLAIALAALSLDLFLLSPRATVNPIAEIVRLAVFILAALLITSLQIARKRAEKSAIDKQRSLDVIIDTVPSPVILVDSKGRITLFNQACEVLTGYTRNEVAGKSLIDIFVPPAWAHEVGGLFGGSGALDTRARYESPWITKAGEERLIEWHYASLDSIEGKGSILGAGIDITERKREEERLSGLLSELRSQSERLDAIFASVPGVVWEIYMQTDDCRPRLNFVSEYAEKMLGYSIREWFAESAFWLKIIHADDRERAGRTAGEQFASGKGGIDQFRWIAKDGRAVWVEARSSVFFDEKGTPLGMRGVTTDITQQKLAEEQLADENRFREAIEESMLAGVAVIDLEGRQTYVNHAFCEMVGWGEEDLVGGMPPYLYWPPEELGKTTDAFSSMISGQLNPSGFEQVMRRSNEERFHAIVLASPLKNSRGEISGWLASIYDITERKRIERERELLLAGEQKAREEAERAYRARDEFIAMVSHELRTPLNSIIGWLHIVRSRKLDEATTARALETIENNARMQARLINDLLDISRISSGKLNLNIAEVDLARVIETATQQA
ncbi:MAG TPA: PAS domain S-box protein, partial [Blastocatellia bacterium]|nr:PAS domain S-box protein [Blastocatellia bacterium]